jgi:outer membrane protein assembly factor BamB
MSAERFIEILEQHELVSDRLLEKLRKNVSEAGGSLSATALAKFLVQKKHLSQLQALEVLRDLSDEDTSDFESATLEEVPAESSSQESSSEPEADEGTEDFQDDSSIFAPLFTSKKGKKSKSRRRPADGGTDPGRPKVDKDAKAPPPKPAKPSLIGLAPVQNLETLSASKASEKIHAKLTDDPLVADVNLAAGSSALRSPSSILRAGRVAEGRSEKEGARQLAAQSRRYEKKRRKKKSKGKKSEWDSPLILAGGGALALLVLCALLVTWMLNWESGDEQLQQARMSRDDGSYTQAISHYEHYLEKFQRHSERSQARVELALVRLRQTTESGNFPLALDVARDELAAIEDEDKFGEAHYELAALLPRIAGGLADRAEGASDPETAAEAVESANAALMLCSNTKYVPKSLRDETELGNVQRTLDRVARRQKSYQELQHTLQSMDEANAAGDTRAVYKQLVEEHPELDADPQLAAMLVKTSAAERDGIRFVVDEQKADTTERPVPWTAALAVAHRVRQGAGAGGAGAACVRVDGAVYALDAATGQVLWRKYVGFGAAAAPISVGNDVLVVDVDEQELMRLEARTGKLRWRQAFGEPIADPLAVGGRIYVAAESGRLYVVDANSGVRMGYLQFAQPLRVAPVVDRGGKWLYLTGDHSSIYTISLSDLTCLGVYYLGHLSGSVRVPPAHLQDKLAVLENDGVETSRLHLLALDEAGAISGSETERRLTGLAAAPPLVDGRRLAVITDRGQIEVFEVSDGKAAAALIPVATRTPTSQRPLVRHVAMADGHFWVGDTRLTKYGVLSTGNRLPVEEIDDNYVGATFDHPFQLIGTTLVHVRRLANRAGVAVAAVDTERGQTLWETDLAVPPAWSPIVDASSRALAVANANGFVFRIGPEQLRSRVQDEALEASSAPSRPPSLTAGVDLGGGRAAFTAATASDALLLYDPSQQNIPLHWVTLPSRLACEVSPFGSGVLVPLEVGQVFFLDPGSGRPLATPYQPRLQPRLTVPYRPAAEVSSEAGQFVITDGREKIFLVSKVDQPQPHLSAVTEAMVGPYPIVSPIVVSQDMAWAVTEGNQLIRFRLPSLEPAGETDLRVEIIAGPFRAGAQLLLVTADERLLAVTADGAIAWSVPLELGDLAGPPLATDDGIYLAYRSGIVERRAPADGQVIGQLNVLQPLAAGPVRFMDRVVLSAHDGTLLVVDQP